MRDLSISRAWDETKAIAAKDGRLLISIALALVALPAVVTGVIRPNGLSDASTPMWVDLVMIVASLIVLAGQLALIRLALGPSITVAGAVRHGFARMPIYFLSAILILVALFLLAVPFAFAMAAMGVPMKATSLALTPGVVTLVILYVALVFFVAVRMIMSGPSASAEPIGPVAILARSWALTAGHWWRLFGFLVLFVIGALAVLLGVAAALGVVVAILLGPIEPMSASALVLALAQSLINAAVTTMFAVMLARIYVQLSGRGEVSVPTTGT